MKKIDTSKWPRATVSVEATLTFDPERSQNHMHMAFADTSCKLSRNGKEVGELVACIGGLLEVRIGKLTWSLSPQDVFEAVEKVHKKYMKSLR